MRNHASPILAPALDGVLVLSLGSPERWWYLSDLARQLGTGPSSLQRPIERLVRAGVLERRKEGNLTYYRPDRACPFLPELIGLVEKTSGVVGVLRDELTTFADRIAVAFVYGSFARGAARAGSDIDLMVIGDVGLADLSPALRRAERRLGRAIDAAVYTPREFAQRLKAGSTYPREAVEKDKRFVFGSEANLAGLAQGRSRRAAPDQRARNRGRSRPGGAKPQGRRGQGPLR